ncbi:MAG: hypothetical protein CL489_10460 [Acidobacteria bacterium]|nr:hypothetical protein [Acidobacteriota bacterium]|tara:strand:+ start:367 stop:645 length:279 start_codon:yes stop_codon:yes gene_type:complete
MSDLSFDDLARYHEMSRGNKTAVIDSDICICFFCLMEFDDYMVNDFVLELDTEDTACCPYCGIDAVIPFEAWETNMQEREDIARAMYEEYFK